MVDTSEKPTLSDEERRAAEELLEVADAQVAERIKSWADLYECVKELIYAYFEDRSKSRADFTLVLLLSFFMAMEEAPEEGDAAVLMKAANRILFLEPERTGILLTFKSKEALVREALSEIAGAIATAAQQEEPENSAPGTGTNKRVLH